MATRLLDELKRAAEKAKEGAEELGRAAQEALESPQGQEILQAAGEMAVQAGNAAYELAHEVREAAEPLVDEVRQAAVPLVERVASKLQSDEGSEE